MKLKQLFFVAIIASLTLSGCKSKKEEQLPILRPASMDYTAQDSADIWKLCNQFAEFFGKNDFESCSLMLNFFDEKGIRPYTDKERKEYMEKIQLFSNYGCRVESFVLRSDRNNSVSLKVKLFPVGTMDDDQGITRLVLNPVKVEDTWYLTLRDQNAKGVKDLYEEE
jgi:hypothetical protein